MAGGQGFLNSLLMIICLQDFEQESNNFLLLNQDKK